MKQVTMESVKQRIFPAANGKETHLRADLKDKTSAVESKGAQS